MTFETLVTKTNQVIPLFWPKDQKYIGKQELHDLLLAFFNLPSSKQKNSLFCNKLKAAIFASIHCKEVSLNGYHKYKRL